MITNHKAHPGKVLFITMDHLRADLLIGGLGNPGNPTVVERNLGLGLLEANAAILRESRWKYVHFNGGLPPLLFDIQSDPAEPENLAVDSRYDNELLRLSRKMLDHRMLHQFKAHSAMKIGYLPSGGPVVRKPTG